MRRLLVVLLTFVAIFAVFVIPGSALLQPNHFYIPFSLFTVFAEENQTFAFSLSDVDDRNALPSGAYVSVGLTDAYNDAGFVLNNPISTNSYTSVLMEYDSYDYTLHKVSYELYAKNFVLPRGALSGNSLYLVPQDADATLTHTVTLTFSVARIERGSSGYERKSYIKTVQTSFTNGFDILAAIASNLPTEVAQDGYLFFNYVDLIVSNSRTGTSITDVNFTLRGAGTPITLPSTNNWFNQYDLSYISVEPADPSDGNFVSWASSALETMFSTELFHGITINEILTFALIFGLVFWFLKLTV